MRDANGFGPPVTATALRSESNRLRVASVMPIESSLNGLPFGASTAAPFFTQRLCQRYIGGDDHIAAAGAIRNPVVGLIHAVADHDALDQLIPGDSDWTIADDKDFHRRALERMPLGDAIHFLLYRAGISVDVNGNGFCLRSG